LDELTVRQPSESDRPRIGVHVLAAFVFCARAGLIAYETKHDDDGTDHGLARLDYTHPYELHALRKQLNVQLNRMLLGIGTLVLAIICHWLTRGTATSVFCIFAELFVIGFLVRCAVFAYPYFRDLSKLDATNSKEPNPLLPRDEPVKWWSMHSAGFESIKPPRAFHDKRLNLIGTPWRLLRKGNTLIPVFRARKEKNIKQQHRIRIAAYCHLISYCEGSESPYGILLDPSGYEGTAIKVGEAQQSELERKLAEARSVVDLAMLRNDPHPPRNERKCLACPHGQPEQSTAETPPHRNLIGETVTKRVLLSTKRGRCHSICGDRFNWLPPHRDILVGAWQTR